MGIKIRLGTRDSLLAMIQTRSVAERLMEMDQDFEIEIVPIRTSGDWDPRSESEGRLCEAEGGKGMFVREIEQALLDDAIDIAVHSMKDVPSFLPDGVVIHHTLGREDARDAFISPKAEMLQELHEGATVGTASMRRQAFVLAKRPDLQIVPFRGNVNTRLGKLRSGQVDATFLAVAGLQRLGMADAITRIMAPEEMLPAAGQGAIGMEILANRKDLYELLEQVHCKVTGLRVRAERAALQELDGSCHTPIGAYAEYKDGEMYLRVAVASPDGKEFFPAEGRHQVGDEEDAEAFGSRIANQIKEVLPEGILD